MKESEKLESMSPEQRKHYERIKEIMGKKSKRVFGYNKIKEEWRTML